LWLVKGVGLVWLPVVAGGGWRTSVARLEMGEALGMIEM